MRVLSRGLLLLSLLIASTGVSAYVNTHLLLAQAATSTGLQLDMVDCLNAPNLYWDQQTRLCYTEKQPCIDPDGGRNYEDKAHTFGWHSWHTDDRERRIRVGGLDACLGDTLREHVCTITGDIAVEEVNCPYGCVNGVCVAAGSGGDEPIINHVWVTQKPYCQSTSWIDSPENATCGYDFWVWVDARATAPLEVRLKVISDPRVEYGIGDLIAQYWYGNDRSTLFHAYTIAGYREDMLPSTQLYRVDATANGKTTTKFVKLMFATDVPQTEDVPPPGRSRPQPTPRSSSSSAASATSASSEQCPDVPREKLPSNCHYVVRTRGKCPSAQVYCQNVPGEGAQSVARPIPPAGYEDKVLTSFEVYDNPFPDTNVAELEGKAAAELYRRAVIGGFPDGRFRGSRLVNRAEAAKFLLLARFGDVGETANSGRFPDVLDGQWYVRFVVSAAVRRIIDGYPDGTFRPGDSVNTAEMLAMLTRTFDLEHDLPHSYSDVEADAWFSTYAGIAEKYDLFPERSGQLHPERNLTRREVAIAIYQLLSKR